MKKDHKRKFDYIVIGSGIGGLSSAIYLAQAGYSVLILERHNRPGGYTHSFMRKECCFDSAVRIVAGANKNGLLNRLLKKMNIEDLESVELEEIYTAVYPKHKIKVRSGIQGLIRSYSEAFTNDVECITNLIAEMEKIYYSTIELLENENPISIFTNSLYSKYMQISFQDFLEEYVENPELIYCLQSMCGYFGASPKNGSAAYFSYAIMSFFIEGAYYIKGSFQKLSLRIIKELKRYNCQILLNSEVEKIICDNNIVSGVRLIDGTQYECNKIIYNGDYKSLIGNLISTEKFPDRYIKRSLKMNIAMSAFEVFIITDLKMEEFSLSHENFVYNLYNYSEIYEKHKKIREGEIDLSGIAISCPTLVDGSLCPEGNHLIIISTAVSLEIEKNWNSVKVLYMDVMIKLAEKVIPGLSNHILYSEAATPKTMHRYTLNTDGSSYGWEQNFSQIQYRPKQKTPIKGLYLVGHWTDPGGGVVSAMLSGYKIANKLIKEEMKLGIES